MRRRPELDGIRGIAIALVVLSHVDVLPQMASVVGVTLFFVLSGYLITSILLDEQAESGAVDLISFYIRRARRLIPALLAMLVVVALAGVADPGQVMAALFYGGDVVLAAGGSLGSIAHTWSLSLEEQFYLVWPVTLMLLGGSRHRLASVALAGIAVSLAARLVVDPTNASIYQPEMRMDAILFGCLLAIHPLRLGGSIGRLGLVAVGLLSVIPFSAANVALGTPAIAIACVAVIASAADLPELRWRPWVELGLVSYALYLWHYPLSRYGPIAQPGPVVVVSISIAMAWASTRFIEAPFRRLARAYSLLEPMHDLERAGLRPGRIDLPSRWCRRSRAR